MIDINQEVKLNGYVSEVSTGSFVIKIKEFFVDGLWYQFSNERTVAVTDSSEYNNHLTSPEIKFLLESARKVASTSNLTPETRVLVESITRKLTT